MQKKIVPIKLGLRSYDILIGKKIIEKASDFFFSHVSSLYSPLRAVVVTDSNVKKFYLKNVQKSFSERGIQITPFIIAAGECSKNFAILEKIVEHILVKKLDRYDLVIALGGGVVGDLTGFAAGIVRRGIRFIQIPTSLLAQVDSSVGGKTGINTKYGKNLVGVFHQPSFVLIDTATLNSLPSRELRAGYAEMVKYGLINQPDFFLWLEKKWQKIFDGESEQTEAIANACQFKAEIVIQDERETNEKRALLNLGHTFGHVLEAATEYNSARLVHGEAIAIGIVMAHEFSARLHLCDPELVLQISKHLQTVGLPTQLTDIPGNLPDIDVMMEYFTQDKKITHDTLTFILTRGLGQSFLAKNIEKNDLHSFLVDKLVKND